MKFIKIHSHVDLITNSSTELFMVDTTNTEKSLVEIIKFLCGKDLGETEICQFKDYKYKDSVTIPDEINPDNLYAISADQNDGSLITIIENFFTLIDLEYNEQ